MTVDLLDLLDTLAGRIVAYVAALGALGWLVRRGWKLLRKIDTILRVAQAIMAEMQPNGGNSMRDAVNDLRAKLDAHLAEHAKAPVTVNVTQGQPTGLPVDVASGPAGRP